MAIRTVKQSSVAREAENGEEAEDEAAEFGEEDLFHQQVEAPGSAGTPHPTPTATGPGPVAALGRAGLGQATALTAVGPGVLVSWAWLSCGPQVLAWAPQEWSVESQLHHRGTWCSPKGSRRALFPSLLHSERLVTSWPSGADGGPGDHTELDVNIRLFWGLK